MKNYNDGNWHAHNGSCCPVHPKSLIEAWYPTSNDTAELTLFRNVAADKTWVDRDFMFRVIKEHKEPREFWIEISPGGSICAIHDTDRKDFSTTTAIHVREVIE